MDRALGLDSDRMSQLKGPERKVAEVAEEIAELAVREVPPVAPFERRVLRMVRPIGRGTEPEVPIERLRHGGVGGGGVAL